MSNAKKKDPTPRNDHRSEKSKKASRWLGFVVKHLELIEMAIEAIVEVLSSL